MLKITYISHNTQRFTTRTGKRVEIEPGASENVAIDADNIRIRAKVNAGLIAVAEQRKDAKPALSKAASAASSYDESPSKE